MHSAAAVVFVFLLFAWGSTALPCNSDWSAQSYSGVRCPEEVILLTISEASDESEPLESAGESYRISSGELDLSDQHLSGEVVESADNDKLTQSVVLESDPLSSSQSENHEESGCGESDGDVVTTEGSVKTDN